MRRLIDANALMDSHWWESLTDDFDKARAKIIVMSAPTVDAVEVVYGRWIKKTEDYVYYYACSECGEPVLKSQWGHDFFSDYCPNCGAKMNGGNDDA